MKIVLFRDGQKGVLTKIPGERPIEEIGELLGGKVLTNIIRLSDKLGLMVREDAEELRLPIRYAWHKLGRAAEPVAGDCAVVRMTLDGHLTDITLKDVEAIDVQVRPTGGGLE